MHFLRARARIYNLDLSQTGDISTEGRWKPKCLSKIEILFYINGSLCRITAIIFCV